MNTRREEVKIQEQLFPTVASIKKGEASKPYDFSFSDSEEQQIFFKVLRDIENDSIESIAESLMDPAPDNKRFLDELIEWMHATRIEDVVVPETDDKVSMILSNKHGASITVSARPASNGEFRAEVLRKFIKDAQQNPQKSTLSVFIAVEQYLREFANNPLYKALIRPIEVYFFKRIEANVFDSQTEVYGNLRDHVRKCLLKAGTLYSQEKIRDPRLVLQQVNQQIPLPKILVNILNVNKALEQNLINMKQQLESEQPFKKESAEYHALNAFHGQLQEARTTVLSSNLSEPDIARFKKTMSDAIAQAEQSDLRHHLGWWAEVIKPILICIALFLTLFTALIIPAVRESTSHAFWKPAIDSFKDAKSKIAEYSM